MFTTLFIKELRHYFNSPIAYVFLIAFFAIGGWFFVYPLFVNNQASLSQFFEPLPFLLVFFAPALSMRLFSEERRQGTLETLVTLPVSDSTIVLSKFFGALAFMAIALIGSFLFAALVSMLGNLEWGVVVASYIGALLMTASMLSYGMFISSLTTNQIIAFIISSIISLVLVMTGIYAEHYQSFIKGIIDLRDVVFFVSIVIMMCLLTKESLDLRNVS